MYVRFVHASAMTAVVVVRQRSDSDNFDTVQQERSGAGNFMTIREFIAESSGQPESQCEEVFLLWTLWICLVSGQSMLYIVLLADGCDSESILVMRKWLSQLVLTGSVLLLSCIAWTSIAALVRDIRVWFSVCFVAEYILLCVDTGTIAGAISSFLGLILSIFFLFRSFTLPLLFN